MRVHSICRAIAAVLFLPAAHARADIPPDRALLLYNSRNTDSTAIRDAYLAARPGVLSFDLNSAELNVGSLTRADYLRLMRDPVRRFLSGESGAPDRSSQVIVLITTRGLPARVLSPNGTADEFLTRSAWASVESELTLLQQDLESSGSMELPFRYSGTIANPAHRLVGVSWDLLPRTGIREPKAFVSVPLSPQGDAAWSLPNLGPGEFYLVCRLDSAATPGGPSALANTLALISRSTSLTVDRCEVQALLDEWAAPPPPPVSNGFELDDGPIPPIFAATEDFEETERFLDGIGVRSTHDETFNFVTGPELMDLTRPLIALGTYGENHSAIAAWGENPPGTGTYVTTYSFHPAAVFIAYESWNGTSIYAPGTSRGGQQQALDFIARGGSFTVATVMEPFTFTIADMDVLLPNLLHEGLTFAEAAYASLPALSWQSIPVGDPLARLTVTGGSNTLDLTGDGTLNAEDLYRYHAAPQSVDCDGSATAADARLLQQLIRARETGDSIRSGL